MKSVQKIESVFKKQEGKIGYILAWLIGIPIPILLAIYFLRGCN